MKYPFAPLFLVLVIAWLFAPQAVLAQASSFTYQGQLRLSGEPFTGMADLEFRLYDQLAGGMEIGSAQSLPDWPVEDGLFQVELNFGAAAFDGSERYLEVRVDDAPLNPRQKITASPFALRAISLTSGVVSGVDNIASGSQSTVGGGELNTASVAWSTIGGGFSNAASGEFSTVDGGLDNTASGNISTVSGGFDNTASGSVSTVGGGASNEAAGDYSFVVGRGARNSNAAHDGVFMFADSQDGLFVSTRANAFFVRASGGAEFRTENSGLRAFSNATGINNAAIQARAENANGIAIFGVSNSTDSTLVLNNGATGDIIRGFNGGSLQFQLQSDGDLFIGGSLTQNSDRNRKEAIEPIEVEAVLEALRELPLFSWRYKHDHNDARHIGPMAQDFHAAFGYGSSPNGIAVVDAQGVALAAIQALAKRNTELDKRNEELAERLAILQQRQQKELTDLRTELAMLRDQIAPRIAEAGQQ